MAGQVAAASAAPVYGYLETYLGAGLVGGAIPDLAAHGRDAARLALRVLNGEPASTIPVIAALPAKCVVDERAMRRFGIDQLFCPQTATSGFVHRPYGVSIDGTCSLLWQRLHCSRC